MTARVNARSRNLIGVAALGLSAAVCAAPAAGAETINLTIDFAKVVKYDRTYRDILIGNPGIADATVRDDKTIVLTGKAAGTTNLIVLDDKGEEIANSLLRVASDTQQLTTVFFGSKRQTFSCAPTCEQVIVVGDDTDAFTGASSQIQARKSFSAAE